VVVDADAIDIVGCGNVNCVREAVCVSGAEIESELMDIVEGEEKWDTPL